MTDQSGPKRHRAKMTRHGLQGAHGRLVWDEASQILRCTADAKHRIREGAEKGTPDARCGNEIRPGYITCRNHGSGTEAAKQAARLRVTDLLLPSLQRVGEVIAWKGDLDDPATRKTYLDAARMLLRYGVGEQMTVDVTTEVLVDRINRLQRRHDEQEDDGG